MNGCLIKPSPVDKAIRLDRLSRAGGREASVSGAEFRAVARNPRAVPPVLCPKAVGVLAARAALLLVVDDPAWRQAGGKEE